MLIYLLIYFFSFLFAWGYSISKNASVAKVCKILSFFVLLVPAALRYRIGTDYVNYENAILASIASQDFDVFEWGWTPVLQFINYFGIDIQFFFVFASFFTLLFIFLSIEKEDFFLAIPCYVSIAYLESYSLVRQALAVAICMYAIRLWLNEKYWKSLVFILVGSLFHKSTLFFLPVVLFINQRLSIFGRYRNVFWFCSIFVLFSVLGIANVIMTKIVGETFFAVYIETQFNADTEMGSGMGMMCRYGILFCALFFSTKTVKAVIHGRDIAQTNKLYQTTCVCALCLFAFYILSTQIHIFNRLTNLLSPIYMFLVPSVYHSQSRFRQVVVAAMMLVLFVLFLSTIRVSSSDLGGGLGITPYRSIFDR